MNQPILTRFSILFAVVGVFLTAFCPVDRGDTYELRYQFRKGDKFRYVFSTEQNIIQTIQGREEIVAQTIRFGYLYEVKKVYEDKFDMKVSYENVYHRLSNARLGIGEMVYDSESNNPMDEIPPLSVGFAGLVGQSFAITMSEKGKVLAVKGIEQMIDGMMKKLAEEMGSELETEIRTSVRKQFTEESLSRDMENQMAIFPDAPVALGESWTIKSTLQSMARMNKVSRYTLKKVEKGKAFLAVESDLETEDFSQDMISGMNMSFNMGGTQDGTIEIQLSNGTLIDFEMEQNISGEVEAQGTSWPIMIQSDIVLKLEN